MLRHEPSTRSRVGRKCGRTDDLVSSVEHSSPRPGVRGAAYEGHPRQPERLGQLGVLDGPRRGGPVPPLVIARSRTHSTRQATARECVVGELLDQPESNFGSTFSRAKYAPRALGSRSPSPSPGCGGGARPAPALLVVEPVPAAALVDVGLLHPAPQPGLRDPPVLCDLRDRLITPAGQLHRTTTELRLASHQASRTPLRYGSSPQHRCPEKRGHLGGIGLLVALRHSCRVPARGPVPSPGTAGAGVEIATWCGAAVAQPAAATQNPYSYRGRWRRSGRDTRSPRFPLRR